MTFDKDAFLETTVEGELETTFTPLPEDDYEGYIDEVEATELKGSPALQVTVAFTDQKAIEFLENEKPTHRETIFLDIDENGRLEMGKNKNVKLGAWREAAGQNDGKPWAPSKLRGAGPLMFKCGHRDDKEDPDKKYLRILRVSPAGGRKRRDAA